ncbi:hypothetical protein O3M35_010077 [Rhynocoris fuscipes]|uniref:Uncharacterized protein n=1 Tax=Rhynocoris fuscipes TaxID=488301 RepID=A0AAW1D0G2_9HEMI
METPGVSLFQGSDSIKLNSSNQREEEEEFIAEERKRKDELNNLFQNAFDDLIEEEDGEDDDDEVSTPNSSHCGSEAHPHHYSGSFCSDTDRSYSSVGQNNIPQHQMYPTHDTHDTNRNYNNHIVIPAINGKISERPEDADPRYCPRENTAEIESHVDAYKRAELHSIEQLKVLYDVRMREIERLKKELDAERHGKEQILRKLAICETEKSGILSNNKQINETLELSNKKVKELESEVCILKDEMDKVEKERDKCKSEVEILQMENLNLKQQMTVMQRCEDIVDRKAHFEAVTESLKRKHEQEILSLQQQYDLALQKIREKEDAQTQIEKKLEEIERRHVATLLNKCDATVRQEATVKTLLDQANAEKLELTKKINALQAECNMLRNDLEQYESISRQRLFNNSSSDEHETDSMIQLGISSKKSDKISKNHSSTAHHSYNHYTDDMVAKLKDELHRAIIGQRSKRNEIKKLQEQVQQKEMFINTMKEREQSYMNQVDTLKQEIANVNELLKNSIENSKQDKLTERIISLETEVQKLNSERENYLKQIETLENDIKSLQIKLKQEEMNKKRLGDEYIEFHDKEIAKLNEEQQKLFKEKELEWSKKMEEILNENDEVKRLYLEIRSLKESLIKQLEEESAKVDNYMKERDELKLISDRLKDNVKSLENHILGLNQDKQDLENKLETLKKEYTKSGSSDDKIQNEVFIMANGSHINLEKMREEVALAKLKFIELEKSMKLEYDERIAKLQTENKKLKDLLMEKELKLTELTTKQCNKVDASTLTQENDQRPDVSVINAKYLEDNHQLQQEIDRLKTLEFQKSQEILKMEFEYQQKLQNDLEEFEAKLLAKHKEELSLTEDNIKKMCVQYYASEINKLMENHKMQIENIGKQYTMKIKEIENILLKKEADLKELNSKLERNKKEIEELNVKLNNARKKALSYKNALTKAKTVIPEMYNSLSTHINDKVEAINLKEMLVEKHIKAIENELKVRT